MDFEDYADSFGEINEPHSWIAINDEELIVVLAVLRRSIEQILTVAYNEKDAITPVAFRGLKNSLTLQASFAYRCWDLYFNRIESGDLDNDPDWEEKTAMTDHLWDCVAKFSFATTPQFKWHENIGDPSCPMC